MRIAQNWGALDTVILNAGTCEYIDAQQFDAALFERVVRINLLANSYCLEIALPLLRAGSRPHLVGVVSSVTYWALPRAEVYGASKVGLRYLLESLRIDLAQDGIDVTLVSPGFVDTPLTEKNDFPMPLRWPAPQKRRSTFAGAWKSVPWKSLFPHCSLPACACWQACPSACKWRLGKRLARTTDGKNMKIAIIGSGISGFNCGYLLHKQHDISVSEASDWVGGHTHTVNVNVNGKPYAVDTGFIVFNDWTYPNFITLMDQLGVRSKVTEMSFSVRDSRTDLEYNGNTLNSLFAQRSNLLSPAFWGMLRDILRFNRQAIRDLEEQRIAPDTRFRRLLAATRLWHPLYRPLYRADGRGDLVHVIGRYAGLPAAIFCAFFQESRFAQCQ